ncbi:MAG TPA: S41 family peptidase [Kofleriaceae bacterium]|nr:S41 family peptidase [Kofleriaceae bacterium]
MVFGRRGDVKVRAMIRPAALAFVTIAACGGAAAHPVLPPHADPAADRASDLDWLLTTLEQRYVYLPEDFNHAALYAQYVGPARAATTRDAWIGVLEDVVGELYDHHVSLGTNTAASPRLVPSGADLWGEVTPDGFAKLTAVRRGAAADRAGLRAGMIVTRLGGVPADEAIARRRPSVLGGADREAASWAFRVLLAGTHDGVRTLTACTSARACADYTLDAPELPDAPGPVTARLDGDLGYLRLENSLGDDGTVAAFDAALAGLAAARGLVLDLRNTPSGGSTDVAEPILGRFIDAPAPYQQVFVPGHDAKPWLKTLAPRAPYEPRPLVVLVDHWTGSMGEGMAVGLDGLHRATVVGTAMAGLRGGIGSFELPRTGIPVRFPIERLAHVDGTPRERWLPPILVDVAGGEPVDPILARGEAELTRLLAGR